MSNVLKCIVILFDSEAALFFAKLRPQITECIFNFRTVFFLVYLVFEVASHLADLV